MLVMVTLEKNKIKLDSEGFPESNEFYFPVLKSLECNSFTEEEIIENLKSYFDLSEEQINQKVSPKSETNGSPDSKLKSRTHFAIVDFERLKFIKKNNKRYSLNDKGKYIIKKNISKLNKTNLAKIRGKLDLIEVLCSLSNLKIDVTFLHLTRTGISKNNIDATEHIRCFLKRNGLFDYETIGNGNEFKKFIDSILYTNGHAIGFKTSLYRAEGRGDRRIGLTELNKQLLKEGSIFLICTDCEKLYFFNLSDKVIKDSLLKKIGDPYEILQKLSYIDNNLTFIDLFKKINKRRFILLKEENSSIKDILQKEGIIYHEDSKEFCYEGIKFKICSDESNLNYGQENILVNRLPIEDIYLDNFLEFKQNYFSNESNIKISNKNINNNLKLELDYLNGNLKVIDVETKDDIFVWDLEKILTYDDKFNIICRKYSIRKGNYVFFYKLLCFLNLNFSLLSFFILDKDIESNLGIDIELILDIESNGDFQNYTLKLRITDEKIMEDLFSPLIYK